MKQSILVLLIFFIAGCIKPNIQEMADETSKSSAINTETIKIVTNDSSLVPEARTTSQNLMNESSTDLISFFESYDTAILKSFLGADFNNRQSNKGGIVSNEEYMIEKNTQLIQHLIAINPNCYNDIEMNVEDPYVVLGGLIELHNQLFIQNKYSAGYNGGFPWECIKTVIVDGIGVAGLIEDYNSLIKKGARWSTVRGFVWSSVKRYAGWVAAAQLIYTIVTECL